MGGRVGSTVLGLSFRWDEGVEGRDKDGTTLDQTGTRQGQRWMRHEESVYDEANGVWGKG